MKLNALPMYALAVAGLAAAPSALACDNCTTDASNNNVCYWSGSYGYASCWSGSNGSGFSACYASGSCGYGTGDDGGGGSGGGGGPFFCGSNSCLS